MAWLKSAWQYIVMGALVLALIGMGSLSSCATADKKPSVQNQPPVATACPAGMDCTPQKSAAEKQFEELRKEIAELKKAPPAPTPQAVPAPSPATASTTGSDPAVKYTGRTCTRIAKNRGESTTGFEGYGPKGGLGCWRV